MQRGSEQRQNQQQGGGSSSNRNDDGGDGDSPADEWLRQLNATCNRLSAQYLQLLRAAASADEQGGDRGGGTASGGGGNGSGGDPQWSSPGGPGTSVAAASSSHAMRSAQDPPPPPLAASVASSLLQCQLAAENICVAASSLFTLIRTLRLSLLLTDSDTVQAEQELERQDCRDRARTALAEAWELEQRLMELRRELLSISTDSSR
jgi:hypothetical protein